MIRHFCAFLIASLAALTPSALSAHPHEFVTMRIAANFDKSGRVTGLLYNWTFDPFFTAYAVEGEDANKNGISEQDELDKLLQEIIGNIHNNNYFTAFDANGAVPVFKRATPIAAELKDQQLVVTFDLPFTEPVDTKKQPLRYAIYDDEFYIAMTHDPDQKPVDLINAPSGCKYDLEEPDPDEEIAEFAASLGKNESGGNGLGVQFAEWVTIKCK